MTSSTSNSTKRYRTYARFSPRRNGHECQSNEMQNSYMEEYCKSRGSIAGRYEDRESSGDDEDRPGLWDAINSLKRGEVLLVYKYDRLARSVYLEEYLHRQVAKRGATIEAVVDGRSDSPQDVLVRQILASFAEFEKKIIGARTKAAMARHMQNGRVMGGDLPYGQREAEPQLINGKLCRMMEPDPAEMAIRDEILTLRASGLSSYKIADRFNTRGVPCRGSKWHPHSVRRVVGRAS
jgi:site-specific DNA recombinase